MSDPAVRPIPETIRTTDGVIALRNLHAQIAGLERQAEPGQGTTSLWVGLIDLLALRGELLGCIADYERAALLAEQLVIDRPDDGMAFLTRALRRAHVHRFADALADLDQAERLGIPSATLSAERVMILHQLDCSDEALSCARAAVDQRPDFTSLATLALLHAERGETAVAEPLFDDSYRRYRRVSPFPLAQLDLQRGRMWLRQGDHRRARTWFAAAVQRVPAYAPAQGYLAVIDAALDGTDAAIRADIKG